MRTQNWMLSVGLMAASLTAAPGRAVAQDTTAASGRCFIAFVHGWGVADDRLDDPGEDRYRPLQRRILWQPNMTTNPLDDMVLAVSGGLEQSYISGAPGKPNAHRDGVFYDPMHTLDDGPNNRVNHYPWAQNVSLLKGEDANTFSFDGHPACKWFVPGYDATIEFFKQSNMLAESLERFIKNPCLEEFDKDASGTTLCGPSEGKGDDPSTHKVCSCADRPIRPGELIIVGHSMGALASRFIINHGSDPAAPFYNARYGLIANTTRYVVSLGAPHVGSIVADAVHRPDIYRPGSSVINVVTPVLDATVSLHAHKWVVYAMQTPEMRAASAPGGWMRDNFRKVPIYNVTPTRWAELSDPRNPASFGPGGLTRPIGDQMTDLLWIGAWSLSAPAHAFYSPLPVDPNDARVSGLLLSEDIGSGQGVPLAFSDENGDGLVSASSSAGKYLRSGGYNMTYSPDGQCWAPNPFVAGSVCTTKDRSGCSCQYNWNAGYIGSAAAGYKTPDGRDNMHSWITLATNHNHVRYNDYDRAIMDNGAVDAAGGKPIVTTRVGTYIYQCIHNRTSTPPGTSRRATLPTFDCLRPLAP